MNDLDLLLTLVENPTRRHILERIVREPSYPLQLSKELGLSTQAVMKNLALMERHGMVEKSEVRSSMGPNRYVYAPCAEFTIVVDMRTHAFSARLVETENAGLGKSSRGLTEKLKEIDERIEELDREKHRLLTERSRIEKMLSPENTE